MTHDLSSNLKQKMCFFENLTVFRATKACFLIRAPNSSQTKIRFPFCSFDCWQRIAANPCELPGMFVELTGVCHQTEVRRPCRLRALKIFSEVRYTAK